MSLQEHQSLLQPPKTPLTSERASTTQQLLRHGRIHKRRPPVPTWQHRAPSLRMVRLLKLKVRQPIKRLILHSNLQKRAANRLAGQKMVLVGEGVDLGVAEGEIEKTRRKSRPTVNQAGSRRAQQKERSFVRSCRMRRTARLIQAKQTGPPVRKSDDDETDDDAEKVVRHPNQAAPVVNDFA